MGWVEVGGPKCWHNDTKCHIARHITQQLLCWFSCKLVKLLHHIDRAYHRKLKVVGSRSTSQQLFGNGTFSDNVRLYDQPHNQLAWCLLRPLPASVFVNKHLRRGSVSSTSNTYQWQPISGGFTSPGIPSNAYKRYKSQEGNILGFFSSVFCCRESS